MAKETVSGAHFKVVGWGPFRLPGERKRWERAMVKAREELRLAEEAKARNISE